VANIVQQKRTRGRPTMTITITAYHHESRLSFARLTYSLTQAEVAALPKWLRLQATPTGQRYQSNVNLGKDAVNGGINETGLKRINKLFALGATYNDHEAAANAYRTRDDLEAAIAKQAAA
jgi:hypothetical protein